MHVTVHVRGSCVEEGYNICISCLASCGHQMRAKLRSLVRFRSSMASTAYTLVHVVVSAISHGLLAVISAWAVLKYSGCECPFYTGANWAFVPSESTTYESMLSPSILFARNSARLCCRNYKRDTAPADSGDNDEQFEPHNCTSNSVI